MILAFGKSGQVAAELVQFTDVTCLGRDDCDLEIPENCSAAISRMKPNAVINAAAYTGVELAETEVEKATRLNIDAPLEMAKCCRALEIPFVHISTDYVFDGLGDRLWLETDATAPLSVYGTTKRDGEIVVMAANPKAVILRTSWVFSQHGPNFLNTMLRLGATRDTLSIVADQVGGPTPARAVAQACHHIATHFDATKTGIYHFAGVPQITWADFARTIFQAFQMAVKVRDITTAEYPTAAKRPLNSRLDCSRIFEDFGIKEPDWRLCLADLSRELRQIK